MILNTLLLNLWLYQRVYYKTTLLDIDRVLATHVEVCGPVVYVRKEKDGDWHITLDNGNKRGPVVVEIIPLIPLSPPKVGDKIKVRGIKRFDDKHKWIEIHPAEHIEVVKSCQ